MLRFIDSQPLVLTPLTPIHIGCGEDFEPTNYVIDEGVLYHFDPAAVPLTADDRRRLSEAVAGEGAQALRRLQRFFFERKDLMRAATRQIVSVASGIAAQYEERIGQVAQREGSGREVINVLEIERTAHHPYDGTAYIPGSSLKGAMRTAWLDRLNDSRPRGDDERAQELERRLLGGAFQSDPFRWVKVSDAAGEVRSRIVFSTNQKKREVFKDGKELTGQGATTRREAIVPAQYRALRAEIRFDGIGLPALAEATPRIDRRITRFEDLAQASNRFYERRLNVELKLLRDRRLVCDEWADDLRQLLAELRAPLKDGGVMLLRVGRHSGAESVTLDGVRSIRIMKRRGEPSSWSDQSTTLWLAAEREEARSGMQPFGFLLAEPASAPPAAALKHWCSTQPAPDLGPALERVRAAKSRLRVEIELQRQLEVEHRAEEEARQRAAEERSARLATLSEQGRQIEALLERLQGHTGKKQPVSGVLYAETQKLIKAALAGGWSEDDKRALAELVAELGFAKIDFQSKEKEIKRSIRQLRGES